VLLGHVQPTVGSAVDTWATVAVAIGAICYAIPVSWDGKWTGKAAIWDHLRVQPPRKVP
jgi:hypothetical protein